MKIVRAEDPDVKKSSCESCHMTHVNFLKFSNRIAMDDHKVTLN